jgi:hypothetical protein
VSWRRARVDLSTRSDDRKGCCVRRRGAKSKCPGQTAESEVTEQSTPSIRTSRPAGYGLAANWPPITGGCTGGSACCIGRAGCWPIDRSNFQPGSCIPLSSTVSCLL